MKLRNMRNNGFTLIELLVVIAVIGVLAAVVLVAVNPLKRIQQGNDAKIKSDVSQLATAASTYATTHAGAYPAAIADMVPSDLPTAPIPPTGYTPYTFVASPAGCTTLLGNCTNVSVSGQLKQPAVAGNLWCFRTFAGTAVEIAVCATP